MKCGCFATMFHDDTMASWMTTHDDTLAHQWRQMTTLLTESCNYLKTKKQTCKTFLGKYSYTIYSGMEGSINEKKNFLPNLVPCFPDWVHNFWNGVLGFPNGVSGFPMWYKVSRMWYPDSRKGGPFLPNGVPGSPKGGKLSGWNKIRGVDWLKIRPYDSIFQQTEQSFTNSGSKSLNPL